MYTRGIQILSAWFILNMLPGIGSLVHLALGTLAIQVAAYASDTLFFEGKNLLVIHASSLLLILGFGLCGMGRRAQTSK